jgi:hypothetical protein
MTLNLRDICQMAIEEISGIAVPSSFVGNKSLIAKRALRFANRAGRDMALTYRWNALRLDYSFPTEVGVASYELPEDFHVFAQMTQWNNTGEEPIGGTVSSAFWAALNRGQWVSVFNKRIRIYRGHALQIYPTPTAVETISYTYYSKYFVDDNEDGDGDAEYFLNDADHPLIDDNLIALDLKWRFRKASRLEWEPEKAEADALRDTLLTADNGGGVLDFSPSPVAYDVAMEGNIPATGAGL